VEFDPSEDFASYRTWGWLPPAWAIPAEGKRVAPQLDLRVRRAIERELAERGYARASGSAAPDFLVTYHLELRRQLVRAIEPLAMQTVHSYHHQGSFEVMASRPTTQLYEIGTLVLDVADGRERQVVWRGTGTRRVPTSFERRADEVVSAIFERFPPDPVPSS
jgi:hypothetical protein